MYNPLMRHLLLALAVLLSGCGPQLVIRHGPERGRKTRVAVLPFRDAPGHPGSGQVASEVFAAAFLSVGSYELVDRGAVDKLVEEQRLGATGMVNPAQAVEIGKLAGAKAVVVGSVTQYQPRNFLILPPARVSLAVRLIDTSTGEVSWTAQQSAGGVKRLLTWVVLPLGALATAFSPTAEDLLDTVSRRICKALRREL